MSGGLAGRRQWHPFTGRERQLAALVEAVERHSLVVVTGPPGVGKTRLVVEAVDRCEANWTYVDLAGIPDADVAAAVAAPGGDPESAGLVLDHAEAALDAIAEILAGLDRPVVVVSQIASHLPGERRVLLGPLDPDDAVALLLLAAEHAGVRLGDDDGIRRLCARLDHLPLAIELAALQLRHRSVAELDAALDDPFAVLVAPGRAPAHRQLEARIAAAVDRLDAPHRAALASLSWFTGRFTRADATALGADDAVLEVLVDHALALADTDADVAHFRLPSLVRAYAARERADHHEDDPGRDRFVAWALATAGAVHLEGPDERAGLDRLDAVASSLRSALLAAPPDAALELAVRLAPYAERRAYLDEGRRDLEELAAHDDLPAARRADAWIAAGHLALRQSDLDGADAAYATAEVLTNDEHRVARATAGLGRVARRRGRYELADALLGRALKVLRRAGTRAEVAAVLAELGRAASLRGRRDDARDFLDEAISTGRAIGDRRVVIDATVTMAKGAEAAGDHAGAESRFRQALREARALGDPRQIAELLGHLADAVYLREGGGGRYVEAEELHLEELALAEQIGDRRRQASALSALGTISYRRTDMATARDRWRRSLDASLDVGDRRTAIATQALLANLEAMDGDPARGWHLISDSLDAQRELGEPRALMFTLIGAIEIARDADRWPEARAMAEEAEALAVSVGDRRTRATAGLHLAAIDVLAGETAGGLDRAVGAAALALAEGERHVTARCLELVATVLADDPATAASAAHLFGAGEMLRETAPHTAYIRPGFRPRYEAAVERCRAALGTAFDERWLVGHTTTPTDAVDHARAVLSPIPISPPAAAAAVRRDGTFRRTPAGWTIGLDGAEVTVADNKGMGYLATLLAQPHHAFAATDLAGAMVVQRGIPLADAATLRDYRRRLRRPETADADREHLEHELASAGGRASGPRTSGSSAERARKAVTKCLRESIARIAAVDPALGDHLRRNIRTGTCCSYEPEGALGWSFGGPSADAVSR